MTVATMPLAQTVDSLIGRSSGTSGSASSSCSGSRRRTGRSRTRAAGSTIPGSLRSPRSSGSSRRSSGRSSTSSSDRPSTSRTCASGNRDQGDGGAALADRPALPGLPGEGGVDLRRVPRLHDAPEAGVPVLRPAAGVAVAGVPVLRDRDRPRAADARRRVGAAPPLAATGVERAFARVGGVDRHLEHAGGQPRSLAGGLRARPPWLAAEVVDVPGLPPTATVLDLGAGTGKLTRLLVTAFDIVVAVEPAEAMRRLLETLCPEAEALAGTGQEVPLADASVDAVFAAQAFHWFDDERAVAEIVRVLRPGGALVLMWNVPAGPWEPSTAAVGSSCRRVLESNEVSYDPLDLGGPRYAPGEWPLPEPSFEPLREQRWRTRRRSTPTGCLRTSLRWAGSPTFPTTSGFRSSTRCGHALPPTSTAATGRRASTGLAEVFRLAHAKLGDRIGRRMARETTLVLVKPDGMQRRLAGSDHRTPRAPRARAPRRALAEGVEGDGSRALRRAQGQAVLPGPRRLHLRSAPCSRSPSAVSPRSRSCGR